MDGFSMMQTKGKVLLLGGTGAIGVYLAPQLREMGYEVHITSRKERMSDDEHLRYIKGNAKDKNFVLSLLESGYDALVDFMIYKTDEFADRYESYLEKVPHYLFTSSYRVYGDSCGVPITEETPRLLDSVQDEAYLATDEYGLTKARQENLLFGAERKNWTIIRPAITYSHDRFQLGTMEAADFIYRALNGKTVIFPREMLDRQATLSWAGDVGKMIARLVGNPAAMGQAYTVSTSEHHSWAEILKCYQKLLGMKVQLIDLSVYEQVVGGPYQIKYDRMLHRVVDNRKILTAVGMTQGELMPLEKGLKLELESFQKAPVFGKIDEKKQKKMDAVLEKTPSLLKQSISRIWYEIKKWLKKSKTIRKIVSAIRK